MSILKRLRKTQPEGSELIDKRVVEIMEEMRNAGIYPTDATSFNKLYTIVQRLITQGK